MPTIPYQPEKTGEDDEDYEIVSFEDFCDKSPGSKTDLLTLNDNINYRLCYEGEKTEKFVEKGGEGSSRDLEELNETSLNDCKSSTWKRKSLPSFAPFGRFTPNAPKASLFSGVIPKPKTSGENAREHRYQRFSTHPTALERAKSVMDRFGGFILLVCVVLALSGGVWWAVCGAVGKGGDSHYRKLWERTHHIEYSTSAPSTDKAYPKYHYHDHNNLSTKNKINATENSRKKTELNKKSSSFTERPPTNTVATCAVVTTEMRFDCHPQDGANEQECLKRGCCWNATKLESKNIGIPYCYYPPEYETYHFINMTENKHGITVYYEKVKDTGYPDEFEVVRMEVKYLNNDALQIKITDAQNKRFEPPYPEIPTFGGPINNLKYRVVVESAATGFKVIRNEDNVTIVDTQNVGGLILSDKFLQISALLPTNKLYGIGERRGNFRASMDWRSYTIFNHDSAPVDNMNLYGTHPFYLALENDGKSHGMLFLTSNAMDVVTQPAPAVTYRSVGGLVSLVLVLGPTPKEVVQQYTELVGRPFMPPYWALGFHLCKFNYGSLEETRDVWKRNRDAGIPFDVQWNDLDYMDNGNDFTYDTDKFAELPDFVRTLHAVGMHYMVLIDPGVSASEKPGTYPPFDRGLEMDIFIKNSSNLPFIGKVWNKVSTAFPDFTHPNSTAYWVEMMTDLHKKIAYDGAWIDMNEPSNMVSGPLQGACAPERLPYVPRAAGRGGLRQKTLCMDARHYAGPHYDWHSLYALTESVATHFALSEIRGRRPFVISRATSPGSGRLAGHWSGDVFSSWDDMRMSVPEILSFSLFGIPMMGADICGFNGNTTAALCQRWMELGAFYPFSRNHNTNDGIPQDPAALGEAVVRASRRALRLRYALLPAYYTAFWAAHVRGDTVATPLYFQYPLDEKTHDIDSQFLIGTDIMIAPILEPNTNYTKAYLPGDQAWLVIATEEYKGPGKVELDENSTVLIRPGSVVPVQPPPPGPVSTPAARGAPLHLVALGGEGQGGGAGALYWDDGDSLNSYEERKYSYIEFKIKSTSLESTIQWWGYGVPSVNRITIYGIDSPIKGVTLNNKNCKKSYCEYAYDSKRYALRVFNINLSLDKPLSLNWTYKQNFLKQTNEKATQTTLVNETVIECKNKDCTELEKR